MSDSENKKKSVSPSTATSSLKRPLEISPTMPSQTFTSNSPPSTLIRRSTVPKIPSQPPTSIVLEVPPHASIQMGNEPPKSERKLYVIWNLTTPWMMLLLTVLLFCFLCQHIVDFGNIKDVKANVVTMEMIYYSLLNFFCIWCICIGFGKPHSGAYATLGTGLLMIIAAKKYRGAYAWTEKFSWLFGSMVVVGEYFYNGLRYRKEENPTEYTVKVV